MLKGSLIATIKGTHFKIIFSLTEWLDLSSSTLSWSLNKTKTWKCLTVTSSCFGSMWLLWRIFCHWATTQTWSRLQLSWAKLSISFFKTLTKRATQFWEPLQLMCSKSTLQLSFVNLIVPSHTLCWACSLHSEVEAREALVWILNRLKFLKSIPCAEHNSYWFVLHLLWHDK
jgi:hypothetical protein